MVFKCSIIPPRQVRKYYCFHISVWAVDRSLSLRLCHGVDQRIINSASKQAKEEDLLFYQWLQAVQKGELGKERGWGCPWPGWKLDHFKALTPARASHCTEGSSWALSWSCFQAFCSRMSCHFVYTALTELIAAFTGCSSKYKPVLTAFYQLKMFMLPTAAVWLFSVIQCTLCSLIKCIHKVYSEIMCSLLKGLDGKAYNHILISE